MRLEFKDFPERTLEDIERDYKKAQEEINQLAQLADATIHRANTFQKEKDDYKIKHELFHYMSELEQYAGQEVIHIKLVERTENGNMVTEMRNMNIDKNGHLFCDRFDIKERIWYDDEEGVYFYQYCSYRSKMIFVGYLDISVAG